MTNRIDEALKAKLALKEERAAAVRDMLEGRIDKQMRLIGLTPRGLKLLSNSDLEKLQRSLTMVAIYSEIK